MHRPTLAIRWVLPWSRDNASAGSPSSRHRHRMEGAPLLPRLQTINSTDRTVENSLELQVGAAQAGRQAGTTGPHAVMGGACAWEMGRRLCSWLWSLRACGRGCVHRPRNGVR